MEAARAKKLLAAERERLERTLAELGPNNDEELSHVDQHLADAGSDLMEKELDTGLSERLKEELAAVERAEERLANGSYGRSVESGEPIPDERLEAMPAAERTVEEQARLGRTT